MHIHITGIAGSLLAPLAIELKKQGHKVTGSDVAFYPPASTLLEENEIKIIPGFKPEKFEKLGLPNLCVMQSFLTPANPEIKFLQEKKVRLIGLGQLLEKFFIKENSIVVSGSAGKSTITSLIGWILETAGLDPSVILGGVANNFSTGAKIGQSDWTVSEGDEFKNWHIDENYKFVKKPRLFYQKAKYAVFTGAFWDHYDIYPSKEDYLENFKKFSAQISPEGVLVINKQGIGAPEIAEKTKAKKIFYNSKKEYHLKNIKTKNGGIEFEIFFKDKKIDNFTLPMIGKFNAENALAAATLCLEIGIDKKIIKKALKNFRGVKRRQELKFENDKLKIYDDFAHSPIKVKRMLEAFRDHFDKSRIFLAYQPGNKDEKGLAEYEPSIFENADEILLPHISSTNKTSREFNRKLFEKLKKEIKKIKYEDDDEKFVGLIKEKIQADNQKPAIVIFAGQKGFRGMIENLIEKFE